MLIQKTNYTRKYVNNLKPNQNQRTQYISSSNLRPNGSAALVNYIKPFINFRSNLKIDEAKLKNLNITNMHIVENNCVRGESLSSKKNRKFLIPIKNSGISDVIDLRDKYTSASYEDLCNQFKLNYHHIPIDSDSVSDREIIDNLGELFSVLDKGNAYIACAQGLHRTDIALALNYVFNPNKPSKPPVMYGHFRNYGFKSEDIARRINSILKNITEQDLIKLGWNVEEFQAEVQARKKVLFEFNSALV